MSISAVVFDRDGVLTSFDWTRAEEDVRRITGLPLEEIERRWGGWLNGLTIDDAFVETQPISEFLSSLARELELGSKARDELVRLDYMAFAQGYPDARPALEEARRRGLKVGVLTNNSLLVSARSLLQCAALHDLVDVVLSSQMIGAAKPDPRAYQAIAEALGVSTTRHACSSTTSPTGLRAHGARACARTSWTVPDKLATASFAICPALERSWTARDHDRT